MTFTRLPSSGCRRIAVYFIALIALFMLGDALAAPRAVKKAATINALAPVILAGLDGLAYRIWMDDPATRELTALRRIVANGVIAKGLVQAFPSVTPAGHSAVWTGAFGDVSGIIANQNPVLPRSEHNFLERRSAFDSTSSQAEPIWVAAARQGVRTVTNNATQTYPFIPHSTGDLATNWPVLISGYGPGLLEPYGVIRPGKTTAEKASIWQPALPRSALPVKAFRWKVKNVTLHGALLAEQGKARGYTAMIVAAEPAGGSGRRVRVPAIAAENVPPRGRALARHFGEPVPLTIDGAQVAGYFRLFELSKDGSDFMLLQVSMQSLAYYDGSSQSKAAGEAMTKATGGFVGNGPGHQYEDGHLGKQLYAGGDGTAERRYLEGMELVLRQLNRHTRWIWTNHAPQLLVDYSPYPDEMEHTWYGLARPDVIDVDANVAKKIAAYRKWGYAALDSRIALFDSLAGPKGSIVFFSDHGMTPVAKDVNINLALQQAGLLGRDAKGAIELARTQAVHNKFGVMVNTRDWLGGIVPLHERHAVVDTIEQTLSALTDPDTSQRLVTAFYRPETHPALGIGGPAGADIYFDLAPGYSVSDKDTGALVSRRPAPHGEHGYVPTRDDMLASFIARGPKFARGKTVETFRAIDVATIVSEVLGIQPPAQNSGTLPAGVLTGK